MMRNFKIFCFIAITAAIADGCKKGTKVMPINLTNTNNVFGKWELRIQRGGLLPDRNFPAGNGTGLQLNIDSTYYYFDKSGTGTQGTYHIAPDTLSMSPMAYNFIYFDHAAHGDLIIRKADTLSIGDSSADGLTSIYVRIK